MHLSTLWASKCMRVGSAGGGEGADAFGEAVRRLGGKREAQERRRGLRREARAAGKDLHARLVGALGERDVVLGGIEADPEVEAAAGGGDATGAELALHRGMERVAPLAQGRAEPLQVARPGGRAEQL